MLGRLDLALTRLEQERVAAAALAVLDPAERTLTLAPAGHLPPLLVPADGAVSFAVVEVGPPLGTGLTNAAEFTVHLPPRSTVLLYTDGLVEDRDLPVDSGIRMLAEAASAAAGPEQLCAVALAALGRDAAADDDTALLAVALL